MTEEELRKKIAQYITGIIIRIKQEEWHYSDWEAALPMAKKILTLIRESGLFMDTEMVKGLMFEVQAKKCDQCPKNKD